MRLEGYSYSLCLFGAPPCSVSPWARLVGCSPVGLLGLLLAAWPVCCVVVLSSGRSGIWLSWTGLRRFGSSHFLAHSRVQRHFVEHLFVYQLCRGSSHSKATSNVHRCAKLRHSQHIIVGRGSGAGTVPATLRKVRSNIKDV